MVSLLTMSNGKDHEPFKRSSTSTHSSICKIIQFQFSANGFKKLQPGDFTGLHNLETLDLAYNNLEKPQKEFWSGLMKLKVAWI